MENMTLEELEAALAKAQEAYNNAKAEVIRLTEDKRDAIRARAVAHRDLTMARAFYKKAALEASQEEE